MSKSRTSRRNRRRWIENVFNLAGLHIPNRCDDSNGTVHDDKVTWCYSDPAAVLTDEFQRVGLTRSILARAFLYNALFSSFSFVIQ
jgi:hypothetical protein